MNSVHVPADTRIFCTLLCIAANHTSLISTPSYTPSSVKNHTVAIIPEDHLLCQPWVCLVKDPLSCSHPLHPCPFQCASHPLNRTGTTSLATLALGTMIPFKLARSPKTLQRLLLPPSTPGASPSLPPLCRTSSQPPPIHLQTSSSPSLPDLLTPSELETMSIGRRLKDLKQNWWFYNRGWTKMTMALQNAHQGMRRTRSISPTSLSPLTTEQSDSPVSSNSSMMEGSQVSIQRQRGRTRCKSLSYMLPQITPLTSQSSPYPPGSVAASGATMPYTPSSKMLSTTSMIGVSLLMSTTITNMTKTLSTSCKRWSSWKQKVKAFAKLTPSVKSTSSPCDSQTGSNTSRSVPLAGPSSQHGRRGQSLSLHAAPLTRDEDVSM